MSWKSQPLTIAVSILSCDDTALRLTCTTTNRGEREIFLVNRLFTVDRAGQPTVDPSLVWTRVVDGLLLVVKQLPDIPDWVSPESPQAPYLTRLGAHLELTETLTLQVPVAERYPYMHPVVAARDPREVLVQGLSVVLGVFTPAKPEWVHHVTVGGSPELAADWGHICQAHEVVSSAPVPLRCRCLTRSLPGNGV